MTEFAQKNFGIEYSDIFKPYDKIIQHIEELNHQGSVNTAPVGN